MIVVNQDNLEGALRASIEYVKEKKMGTNGNGNLNGAAAVATTSATPPLETAMVTKATTAATHTGNGSKTVPSELVRKLYAPLPPEAIRPHPTKEYLSSVKAIFVIERLNEVFGIGGWTYRSEVIENPGPTQVPDRRQGAAPGAMKDKAGMIVVRVVFRVAAFGIRLEQFGGSDNEDRGDAYKGAVTDALSKIASYLGIAIDVYKGGGPTKVNPRGTAVAQPQMISPESKPTREKQPAPWTNRGTMRAQFGRIRERVGEVVYLGALAKYGVTPELNWRDAAQALRCFEELVEQAVA